MSGATGTTAPGRGGDEVAELEGDEQSSGDERLRLKAMAGDGGLGGQLGMGGSVNWGWW